MNKPTIHVAIALLFHQAQVLVGWREAKQHQGNKYEFPGGKVEDNETPVQACRRETLEEVGIEIEHWFIFDEIHHEYDDLIVHLHLFHAGVESHQLNQINMPWTWCRRKQLKTLNFPKANDAIIQRLVWPEQIELVHDLNAVTAQQQIQSAYVYGLQQCVDAAFIETLHALPDVVKAKLIIDLAVFKQLSTWEQLKYTAVCIGADQLSQMSTKLQHAHPTEPSAQNLTVNMAINLAEQFDLPVGINILAYCQNLQDVRHALNWGCDAVLLVNDTRSDNGRLNTVFTQCQDLTLLEHAYFEPIKTQCHVPIYVQGNLSNI